MDSKFTQSLLQIFSSSKNRIFKTMELENKLIEQLGKEKYYELGGYILFTECLNQLKKNNDLSFANPKKTNGFHPPLPLKVKKVFEKQKKEDMQQMQKLQQTMCPQISLSYYQKNPKELFQDLKYLEKLNLFLQIKSDMEIPLNERSFQIFQQEKFLASQKGKEFLKNIQLNLKDLKCYQTYEPFFWFEVPSKIKNESDYNALIVENKDTYDSLKKIFSANKTCLHSLSFSLLIYGEGKKIEKSLEYIKEIKSNTPHFYYFGDIDSEGFSIFYRLFHKYKHFTIQPLVCLYTNLLKSFFHQKRAHKSKQVKNKDHINFFCEFFLQAEKTMLKEIFEQNFLLPQEALRKDLLENLFCEPQSS